MLETTRFQIRRRFTGTVGLTVGIALLVGLYLALWPSMEGLELDELFEDLPPFFQDMFGIIELGTIEGFLAAELYMFIWSLLLGLYFGYAAAGTIAGDLERNRLDVTLSMPVTRTRLLLEEFLALVFTVVFINLVLVLVIVAGVVALDEWIDLTYLGIVHLYSIPYFFACIGIGLVLSVLFDRADLAQRLALGIIFALWIVESLSRTVDQEWLGTIAPSRYYDPSEILVLETVEWLDFAVLVGMTAVLLVAAILIFRRKDLSA